MIGPIHYQRDDQSQIEVKRCFWHRKEAEKNLRRFRKRQLEKDEAIQKELAEKRSREPDEWYYRKSTLLCPGYRVKSLALKFPLTSRELDALLDTKSRKDDKAIALTIKRYEEAEDAAEERVQQLRDKRDAEKCVEQNNGYRYVGQCTNTLKPLIE